MKTKFVLAIASMVFCQLLLAEDEKKVPKPMLELTPGDQWEYRMTIVAPFGSKMPGGEGITVKEVADGIQSQFNKVRIYEGKKKPKEDAEELDTFRIERNGKLEGIEYSDVRDDVIYARGWKKEGDQPGEVFLLTKPLLMVAGASQAGDQWEIKSRDGKSTPLFKRKFRVFGNEKVKVPAGEFDALRIEVIGIFDTTEIKRTYWFAKDVGFIKEEKTYYSKTRRLIQEVMELTKYTSKKVR
jgi:hypothetical protein